MFIMPGDRQGRSTPLLGRAGRRPQAGDGLVRGTRDWALLPGWEVIDNLSLVAAASYSRTGLAAYRSLRMQYQLVPSVAGNALLLRTSSNNGSSYNSGGTDYVLTDMYHQNNTGPVVDTGATTSSINIGSGHNAGSNYANQGVMWISDFNQAGYAWAKVWFSYVSATSVYTEVWVSFAATVASRNAIQITLSAGGTMTGSIILEGLRG